jgi:hypothetical protein
LRWSYVGRSSRVALVLTLAAAVVAPVAVVDLDTGTTAMPKVDGPLPLLNGHADRERAYRPASACRELDARSIVAQRLRSAPFLVGIPPDRFLARGGERAECGPTQLTSQWKASYQAQERSPSPRPAGTVHASLALAGPGLRSGRHSARRGSPCASAVLSAAEQTPQHRSVRCEAPDPYPDHEANETEDQGAVR